MISRFSPQTASRILAVMLTVVLMLVMMAPAVFADENLVYGSGSFVLEFDSNYGWSNGFTVSYFGDDWNSLSGVDSVKVVFNGDVYFCSPFYNEFIGKYYLGNASIFSPSFPDSGEPFLLVPYTLIDTDVQTYNRFIFVGASEMDVSISVFANAYESESGVEQLAVVTPLLNAITSVISWEAVVGIVVGILGVCVVLAFSWWAVLKGVWLLIKAFRRGKISV